MIRVIGICGIAVLVILGIIIARNYNQVTNITPTISIEDFVDKIVNSKDFGSITSSEVEQRFGLKLTVDNQPRISENVIKKGYSDNPSYAALIKNAELRVGDYDRAYWSLLVINLQDNLDITYQDLVARYPTLHIVPASPHAPNDSPSYLTLQNKEKTAQISFSISRDSTEKVGSILIEPIHLFE